MKNTTTNNEETIMLHETCPHVTHRTELWLANDESSYTICDRIVTEYVEEVEDCGNLSDPDLNDLANILLTAMKNHWGERTPDDDDILEADWFEIAEGWFNDIMDDKGWS
jgi:hypothetical protein